MLYHARRALKRRHFDAQRRYYKLFIVVAPGCTTFQAGVKGVTLRKQREMRVVKLWQQGLILLGVPLLCQIFFAVLLIDNLRRIDSAAARESTAKQVLASCQELRVAVFKTVTFEAGRRFLPVADSISATKDLNRILPQQISLLQQLSQADPVSRKIIDAYINDIKHFLKVASYAEVQLSAPDSKVTMSRFVNEHEYMEEIVLSLSQILRQERLIQEKFAPVAREFRPASVRGRKQLVIVVFAGIAGNVLVVLALAVAFGRKTLARMNVLMTNMQRFSERRMQLQTLEGKDELAELDRSFRSMAEARTRAEEMRKTLMEMVSHDLRSPLSSCSLTMSMLLQSVSDSLQPDELRKLRRVNSEMKRLVRMSDSLLAVEKLEAGKLDLEMKETFVEDLLDAALEAVRGAAEVRGIKLQVDDPGETQVYCDKDRMIQVLVNLLSNSVKFAPSNSVVQLRVQTGPETVQFDVIDSGAGITTEQQSALFQRFSQLEQAPELKGQGSGLGLYICKMLVELHQGKISIHSPVSVIDPSATDPLRPGSCFRVEIPVRPS